MLFPVLFLILNHQCMVTNHLKHSVSVIKTNQLILYMEIIVILAEIQTKCINEFRGQNVEFF
jgi:hypothetical protein